MHIAYVYVSDESSKYSATLTLVIFKLINLVRMRSPG